MERNWCESLSANLPTELIIEIFSRLPIESLGQFKCVSKPMNGLISSLFFAKRHAEKAVLGDPNLSLTLDFKFYVVRESDQREDAYVARNVRIPFAYSLEKMHITGSCNGLLCISDQLANEDIFLYNPSTGIYKLLPKPIFNVPAIDGSSFTAVGFGYNPIDDDYKVMRCTYLYDRPFVNIDSYQCEAVVYSLKTNEWKIIGKLPMHISCRSAFWLGNEILIWKASQGFGRSSKVFVFSYNMQTEEFKEICQPKVSYPKVVNIDVNVMNGKVCMIYQVRNGWCVVWMMNEYPHKESWTRLYVIERPELLRNRCYMYLRPLHVLKNGEVIVEVGERRVILYDGKSGGYSREMNIMKLPEEFLVTPYVKTLISPFMGNGEDTTTVSRELPFRSRKWTINVNI